MNTAVVIMAAGKGTRMKSNLPKVLHQVGGKTMLSHVLDASLTLNPKHTIVVTGHGAEKVQSEVNSKYADIICVHQAEQLGTAHAAARSEQILRDFNGTVVILNGDVPMILSSTITSLAKVHEEKNNSITVLSTTIADPAGMGRIVRNENGDVVANIEHKDATSDQQKITEINAGIYAVNGAHLFELLAHVDNNNAQNEYYLPDIIEIALKKGLKVGAHKCADGISLQGVNTLEQLTLNEKMYNQRQQMAS